MVCSSAYRFHSRIRVNVINKKCSKLSGIYNPLTPEFLELRFCSLRILLYLTVSYVFDIESECREEESESVPVSDGCPKSSVTGWYKGTNTSHSLSQQSGRLLDTQTLKMDWMGKTNFLF